MSVNNSNEYLDYVALQATLQEVLEQLNTDGVVYALLHPGGDSPDVSSDVDIILDKHPSVSIEPVLVLMGKREGIRLVQKLHYDVPAGYYYVLQIKTERGNHVYLQLDCLYDPYGINRYHIQGHSLLDGRIECSGYYRCSDQAESIYLLIKRTLKKNASNENLTEVVKNLAAADQQLRETIIRWFGSSTGGLILNLVEENNTVDLATLLNTSKCTLESRYRKHHPLRYLHGYARTSLRQAARFLRPTGLFIVLIGPDGCGKTTVSSGIRASMERSFRSIWRFHWRPKLLPKLGRVKSNGGQSRNVVNNKPPEEARYGTLVSFVRFCYYFLDFIVGYWLIIYPKKARSTFIVGERYFADILVHPERYGFSLPDYVIRLFSLFVPKPDAIILMSGDPQRIHNRKPELDVDTISSQLNHYLDEIPNWGCHLVADANQPPQAVIAQIESFLGELMQHRQLNNQVGRLAFPRYGRTRLLLANDVSNSQFDRLYHPASLAGRAVSVVFRYIPLMRKLICRKSGSRSYKGFNVQEADELVRKTLNLRDSTSISYYLGNGGPRTKITAQVSERNRITTYVKIAGTRISRELLQNENLMLERFGEYLTKRMPTPIRLIHHGDNSYLFTSAPSDGFVPCDNGIDESRISLANDIFLSMKQKMFFAEFEKKLGLSGRIDNIEELDELLLAKRSCEDALALCRQAFSDDVMVIGGSHGDFVPWNMLENSDGELYIFDWEYASAETAALNDISHHMRSVFQFVEKQSAERLVANILESGALADSARVAGVAADRRAHYLALYLINEILRHAETDDGSGRSIEQIPNQIPQIQYLGRCLHSLNNSIRCGKVMRRVCIGAYACEPDKGSEPGVGWNWIKMISRENHIWVYTKANNRDVIEQHLSEKPEPNINFIYVDIPRWLTFWKHGQRGVRTYYYLWQFFALHAARKTHQSVEFNLVHHVTFVNDWLWSFVGLMPVKNIIWGPIGSHPSIPGELVPNARARFDEFIRLTIQRTMRMLDPFYWITSIRSKKVLVINKEIAAQLPLSFTTASKSTVESAIGHETINNPTQKKLAENDFIILFVGRFHRTKCPHLVISAFERACDHALNAKLVMVGRGPEESRLKQQVEHCNLTDRVRFEPWMTQVEVFDLMSKAAVFLFPSTEGGGMVVIESMSLGCPVICLDYGGPGAMVTDETGCLVPVGSSNDVIEGLKNGIVRYYYDRELLQQHSENAIRHVEEKLTWKSKQDRISKIYDEAHQQIMLSSE